MVCCCNNSVGCRHRVVFDLVGFEDPQEVFVGGKAKACVEVAGLVGKGYLLFGEQFHVGLNRFHKSKVRRPGIEEV